MSNTTCRPRGIAKRALALLTAIALATTLTPNFAFAGEANNSASITAEQSSTAGSTGSLSADDATANKADATPDVSESQASGSDSAAGHTAASNSKANAGELTDPSNANKVPSQSANSAKPANQASSTKADTVSATLKISVYGTTLVSRTFSIEKGKTVEDMLNLAVEQGYINNYSHGTPYPGYTAYYVNSITVNGIAYTQPANYSEYWSSTINGAWESDGINGNKIESDGFSYELSYVSNDPNTKFEDYPTSPNAPPSRQDNGQRHHFVRKERRQHQHSNLRSHFFQQRSAFLEESLRQRQLLRNPYAGRFDLLRLITPQCQLDPENRRAAPPKLQRRGNRIASVVRHH